MNRQGLTDQSKPSLVDSTVFQVPRPSAVTVRKPETDTLLSPRSSYELSNRKGDSSSNTVLASNAQTQVSTDYLFYNSYLPTNFNKGPLPTSSGDSEGTTPSAAENRLTMPYLLSNNPSEKGFKEDRTMTENPTPHEPTKDEPGTNDATSKKAIAGISAWKPDVYVDRFIPDSFQGVNQSAAVPIASIPLEVVNFPRYISTFAGTHLLSSIEDPRGPPSFSGNSPLRSLEGLCPNNYGQHLTDCVMLDINAQLPESRTYDLFGAPLTPVDTAQEIYKLQVPGIREGTPRIALGDNILLRQLVLDPVTRLPQQMTEWFADQGYSRGITAPGFTGYEISAVVVAIDRRYEDLIVRANGLTPTLLLTCNVSFPPAPRQVKALHRAISIASQELSLHHPQVANNTTIRPWLERILFPLDTDGHLQTTLPSGVFHQNWFDRSLNYEQMVCLVLICFLQISNALTESCKQRSEQRFPYRFSDTWPSWNRKN